MWTKPRGSRHKDYLEGAPLRGNCRSTPPVVISPRAVCTASGCCTKPVFSFEAKGGERRVEGEPEVAVAANGGGPVAGTMLVTRGVA